MIGQKNLLRTLTKQYKDNTFPSFMIIVAPKNCGKTYFIHTLLNVINTTFVEYPDCKIDTVRKLISDINELHNTVFVLPSCDDMSVGAKNALLKITEEVPNNNKIIMQLDDLANTLPTIKSRAIVHYLELYSTDDLTSYCDDFCDFTPNEKEKVLLLCKSPGEINIFKEVNIIDFYNFVKKVVDNIAKTSGSNAFKIGQSIKFKDTDDGYDLYLFFRAFMQICIDKGDTKHLFGVSITSRYLQDLRIRGINKQSTFDCWLLDIRKAWMYDD